MRIKTASLTNAGGREYNDDTVSIRQKGDCTWVYVGDGLGGYAGGRLASQAAGESLMDTARRGSLLTDERLQEAAEAAHKAVCKVQQEKEGKMKTTLTFLAIEAGRARWMHVGDTRVYHFRGSVLQTQTMDHSVSQMAVLMGEITSREIRFHEDRNRVLRALGGDNAKPELSHTVMLTGGEDVFLLCTDGFWEYVYEEEMEALLKKCASPKKWLAEMEKLVHSRAPSDNDNFTAAAVFC